jgi:hypothetical protein
MGLKLLRPKRPSGVNERVFFCTSTWMDRAGGLGVVPCTKKSLARRGKIAGFLMLVWISGCVIRASRGD